MTAAPDHRIVVRPGTPDDARVIRAEASPEWVSVGCAAFLGLVPGSGAALVGFFIIGGWTGAVVGAAAGAAIVVAFLRSFWRVETQRRSRGRRDLSRMEVESIEITGAQVVELDPVGDIDPALCFQIGESTLLLLQGQWIREPAIYGAPEPEGDPLDDRLNGLPDPYGFPAAAFQLERLPHSGRVIRIEVKGGVRASETDTRRHPVARAASVRL